MALKNVTPISSTTVNLYLEKAGSLFLWCMKQGDLDRNPVSGLSLAKVVRDDEVRSAYGVDDIVKIKNLLKRFIDTHPERYWIPLIGMYSGMRLNEISQLYVSDIVQVDNVWCFDINGDKDKCIKSLSSKRLVPIHPTLIESGLLKYLEEMKNKDCPRLWMNLHRGRDGHSHGICQWYRRFNRMEVTKEPLKVFHSFRHLVTDTMKQAGVAEGVIAECIGHAHHIKACNQRHAYFTKSSHISLKSN